MLSTLRDLWERNLRLNPAAPAVVFDGKAHSFADIVGVARRLASALVKRSVQSQDRVCLLARNRVEWFHYFAACEMYGFVASTLNFRLTPNELAYIINDSAPAAIIFEDDYTDVMAQVTPLLDCTPLLVCIGDAPRWAEGWSDLLDLGDPAGPDLSPVASDAVRLIYTSGTTGKPKGVVRSQAADLALARVCATTSEMGDFARELLMMPMFHVGAQSMASGALWVGGCVYLHRDFDVAAILRTIQDERIDLIHVTPTILQAIIDFPQLSSFDLTSLRTIYYAGAAMPPPLLERALKSIKAGFINCYGSTESGASIILRKPYHVLDGSAAALRRLGSLGQEHPDADVRIVDDAGSPCDVGAIGEIRLRSSSMMTGYWRNPTATSEALAGGWLRTGDVGFMDEEGFVYLVDRKADMIISGGENIYSREVENALLTNPGVRYAAVIGVPDDYWGEAVLAVVVVKEGANIDVAGLLEHCAGQIARYKIPKRFEFVSDLPVLPSAKIDKPALRRRFRVDPGKGGANEVKSV